jgi:hypothetical protein
MEDGRVPEYAYLLDHNQSKDSINKAVLLTRYSLLNGRSYCGDGLRHWRFAGF